MLKGLFPKRGKIITVLSDIQRTINPLIRFTYKTVDKVPPTGKCKKAKNLSMLFSFLQGAKKRTQVFALNGFYRNRKEKKSTFEQVNIF